MTAEKAIEYHYNKFPPQSLKYELIIHALMKATDSLARYDQMLKNMHNNEIFLAPLRHQEAVISSRMEGTISTMDEILAYEADSDNDSGGPQSARSETVETVLYRRALANAQKAMMDGYPLSAHLIRTMHQQLLSFGRGAKKSPGQFKTEQNYLADAQRQKILFVPISPEKLQEGLDTLFNYMHESEHPVLIKTALMHLEFEALHPFQDGNGRIGRMLITLFLWSTGTISAPHFYISGYLEDNKDRYIDTMRQVSEHSDWESWCIFFLTAVDRQAINNLEIAERINALYERMKPIFADALASKWSVSVLDYIFANPIFRNNKFAQKTGISPANASRYMKILVDKGLLYVVEEASGRRPALYSFEPLMELVRI